MISIPDKAKQFLIACIKLLIVSSAFYFIYRQLVSNSGLDWNQFLKLFDKNFSFAVILLVLLLSFLNRFFEILKWQQLVGTFQKITVGDASKQVLAALTAGIFTPNGLGEYAGKALFFEKAATKKIVFLNLICNGAQLLLTVVFGIFGLLYFNAVYAIVTPRSVFVVFAVTVAVGAAAFFVKGFKVKSYSLEKLVDKINSLPGTAHRRNMALALGRYLIFSHQYYILLVSFDVRLPYFILMATICSVYFLASSLPAFQFVDFAVKGSVAIYFFNILGVNEWVVVFITFLMWLLNVVIPVIIGSYFVLRFKSFKVK